MQSDDLQTMRNALSFLPFLLPESWIRHVPDRAQIYHALRANVETFRA